MSATPKKTGVAQVKRKQRIALALRIESAARPAKTCSFCRSLSRTCFVDLSLSKRCSECVRSKHDCDSSGYAVVFSWPDRPVCRFRFGKTTARPRPLTPPPELVEELPTSWLPAFEPDAFLASFFPSGPGTGVPDVVSPSFWASLDFENGIPEAAPDSGG